MSRKQLKPRSVYEYRVDDNYYIGSVDTLVEQLGWKDHHVRRYINKPTENREGSKIGREYPVYEMVNIYDGEVLYVGTKAELAEATGLTMGTINSQNNNSRFKLVPTGEYRFIDDKVPAPVKKAEYKPEVKRVKRVPMNFYWCMMFRDMFRDWRAEG